MRESLTLLERTIVDALEKHPSLWACEEFLRARDYLSGNLRIVVESMEIHDGEHPAPKRAARQEFFQNLSKWFSGQALNAELLSNDLYTAAMGGAKDAVASLRESRPSPRRRTGAGER